MAIRRLNFQRQVVFALAALLLQSCTLPGARCLIEQPGDAGDQAGFEALNCRAINGDHQAQLSLARAYETGVGVEQDMDKAVGWYARAATPTPGTTPVYMAPVGNQPYGLVQNIKTGPAIPGDPWAQFRLGEIYLAGDGVKQSQRRALKWLRRSARQGYAPAAELLAKLEAEGE